MNVTIDENILLFIAGAVFIPVFIFFIKLIIEVGTIKSQLHHIEDNFNTKVQADSVIELESDVRVLKLRVDNLEGELNHMRGRERIRDTKDQQRDEREKEKKRKYYDENNNGSS